MSTRGSSTRRVVGWLATLALIVTFGGVGCGGKTGGGGTNDAGVNNNNAECGNDLLEMGEDCDGSALGDATCASLNLGSGDLGCTTGCTFDTSGCSVQADCGNGVLEYPEVCDGTELAGATCASEGFVDGTVTCDASCQLDTSACGSCGNDVMDPGEECDGADLGSASCESLSLGTGVLACRADCRFDTGDCSEPPVCGNDTAEPGEACDGADLSGASCGSLGYGTGTLGCDATCAFDLGGCEWCGNGRIDGTEACDGTALAGATCASEGLGPGTVTCDTTCQLDTSGCSLCGNGVVDSGEACDGANLDDQSCTDRGYGGGVLACDTACQFDESGCTNCGAADTDPPVASNHVPAPETQGAPRDTSIEADLYDPCDIDTTSITMSISVEPPHGAVFMTTLTPSLTGTGATVHVAATPPQPLPRGAIVTVTLTADDVQGNTLTEVWRFSVVDQAILSPSGGTGTGVLDNGIDEARPNVNNYFQGSYEVGGSSGARRRYIVRYRPDLDTALPAGSLLLGASLQLGVCPGISSIAATVQVDCYRLNIDSRPNRSSWNDRIQGPPGSNVPWNTPGADGVPADREGTAAASVSIPASTPAYTTFNDDVTGLVSDWMGGAGYFGILCTSPAASPVTLCSSLSNAPPLITVTYGPPLP